MMKPRQQFAVSTKKTLTFCKHSAKKATKMHSSSQQHSTIRIATLS